MVPRFANPPEEWKAPRGPLRQAPPEYGGEWWIVNPFYAPNGIMPWVLHSTAAPKEVLPDGFKAIFGPRPQSSDFHAMPNPSLAFQSATVTWEDALKYFKRAGVPEGFGELEVEAAQRTFRAWGMGDAHFYEGRYGWVARFPQSALPTFESFAPGAIRSTHIVVANYQVELLSTGKMPAEKHPFTPPFLFDVAGGEPGAE